MTTQTSPPEREPLRARVQRVGQIIGRVVREQAGPRVYDTVEALRRGFLEARQGGDGERRRALAVLEAAAQQCGHRPVNAAGEHHPDEDGDERPDRRHGRRDDTDVEALRGDRRRDEREHQRQLIAQTVRQEPVTADQ